MRIAPLAGGAVIGAIAAAALAFAGRAPNVRCGAVVDAEAVLDRDLRCEGIAVTLRNPRSVLQLNGHTIASARACPDGAAPSGIAVEGTADDAQILGPGLVQGFVTGVAVADAVRVQVRDVRIADSCGVGLLVVGTDGVRVRDGVFHRNGRSSEEGGAIRVEQSKRFLLDGADVFANATGAKGAAIDLRDCDQCRIVANRIVANAGPGLRLDPESRGAVLERNVVLDQRGVDVFDQSNDGTYVFNLFERGDGLRPPALWPPAGVRAAAPTGPTGCGTMHAVAGPLTTVGIECPTAGGVRGVRNGVIAYRLLNAFSLQPFSSSCDPVEVRPADDGHGGAVRCTNPNRLYPALLEVTCCLM
ncbi:MAG: right-handed parallel beta-helix repeat-containing protein [Deltaproteobacteria bacterium]|nr:right-handed parallel beta-helix repeat-containing protein [Deltaproteobacteria bacterium]